MLLKQLIENDLIKSTYSSSNIVASSYDKTKKELIITFANGGQYIYYDVSLTDYTRFELADSQGAVFNSHIKKHNFKLIGNIITDDLLTEINDLKNAQKKQMLEDSAIIMIHKLQGLLTHYNTHNSINDELFKKGLDAMNEYKTKLDSK